MVLKTDLTLQDEYMFNRVYLEQKDGWAPSGVAIAIHTNFFSSQQEQESIISLSDSINAMV